MNRFKSFILSGALLTAVSLIMRSIGVSFNVYISNTVGAEAMGLFTLISTVYAFAVTLATSGINLAATRLVSEALGEISSAGIRIKNGKTASVRLVMAKCISYSLFFSILSALLLYFLAPPISVRLLQDERCISSLRLLAFTLPPLALASAMSGYFTAVRRVYKNAIAQVAEQLLKIFVCTLLLSRFFVRDVESACLCVVAGGAVAELLSFLLQLLLYAFEKSDNASNSAALPSPKAVKSKLLGIALPVAFSAYLRSGLVTVEHILIPWGLERSGASRERSLAAYGTIHSMVFPIVFFPSAILSSFASLLVPELSGALAEKNRRDVDRIVSNVFETALIFAIGVSGIMIFFSFELGEVIYPSTDAGKYVRMIAPLIPVMYLDTAVDAMLKGLGEQVFSMWVNIADASLSVILVTLLLPRLGIEGYIVTVYFTELINATLSITRLLNVSGIRPKVFSRVVKPLAAIILSATAVKYLSSITQLLPDTPRMIFYISLTAAIYLLLLLILGALKPQKLKKALRLLQNK